MTGDTLQTEFPFTLPNGLVGEDGTLHREGTMRLATAADEILPLKDPRVRSNESYLTVILLSRVVTRLGGLPDVTPQTVESLFVADLAYLQDMYERVNDRGLDAVDATCPDCGEAFPVEVGGHTHDTGDGHAHGTGGGHAHDADDRHGGRTPSTVDGADDRGPEPDAQGPPSASSAGGAPRRSADGDPGNGRSPTAGSRSGDAADQEPSDRGAADGEPAGPPARDDRSSISSTTTRVGEPRPPEPAGRDG